MKRSVTIVLVACLTGNAVSLAHAQAPAALSLRDRVVKVAEARETVLFDEFVFGRFGPLWPGGDLDDFTKLQAQIEDPDTIVPLLGDADANVRTLALMLLFDREEPRYLPRIAAFFDDGAATFDSRTHGSVAFIGGAAVGQKWLDAPFTVGDVARMLLRFYYRPLNQRRRRDATRQFDAWWQVRRERTHCAGWLRVRFLRAYGGSTPIRLTVGDRFRSVRAAVDALPSPDRELLLLGLPNMHPLGIDSFATDAERVAAAKRLGDDVLLDALAGKFSSDDPDLPLLMHDRGRGEQHTLHEFVLDPTRSIFTVAAAERLVALETKQRANSTTGYTSSGWVTTAASLRPDRATEWLLAALDRFTNRYESWQRTDILKALVRLGSEASEQAIVEQFWGDEMLVSFGAQMREWLLDAIAAQGGAKAERLVGCILDHPSFDDADPQTVIALGRTVGALRKSEPIPVNEVRATHHPFGLSRLITKEDREKAMKQYPAATKAVIATAARWRIAVRDAWRAK